MLGIRYGSAMLLRRMYSGVTNQLVNVTDTEKGYSILEMNKKPVNSLDLEMMQEVMRAIDLLEENKDCRGVIITSKLPIFCAGLDILQMYQPNPDSLKDFWVGFQDLHRKLMSSPLVTIAAINGPCPAGGCVFAFNSDYRIMAAGKHPIGLNETLLGLCAPWWLCESLKHLVGQRQAERLLSLGSLLPPEEALSKGMVDQVVLQEELMSVAEKEMGKWLKIPDNGRVATKMLMRKKFMEEFDKRQEEDLNVFLTGVLDPTTQELVGKYLASLKKRK